MRVLIVTGSLLSPDEADLGAALRKQVAATRASSGAWLDVQQKLHAAEILLAQRRHVRSRALDHAWYGGAVRALLARAGEDRAPALTEVSLMTLLAAQGVAYDAATYAELCADDARRAELLGRCDVVFASTTLLRDFSEMQALMPLLSTPDNRVVAGGALAGILHRSWRGCPGVDLLAVGYGELLVAPLVAWMRAGFEALEPGPRGRLVERDGAMILFSGVPEGLSLDALPTPDWRLAEAYHGRAMRSIHYESVRGCPYRCAFCNYPYLFDDTRFRWRSAERIAEDWERYAAQGVEEITCLDSLFTMPRRRLRRLCELLIERGVSLRWICYARADDLDDLDTCLLMRRAGCVQVQIGVESGSQDQLDRMNKRCTVARNVAAIESCRAAGITTLVTLILGYPGESERTMTENLEFMRRARPDFYYASPFNTRVEHVPVMSDESRARFGLETSQGATASAPYWRHDTMSAPEMIRWLRWLNERVWRERLSLDVSLFYDVTMNYEPAHRAALLTFQDDVTSRYPVMKAAFGALRGWVQRRLERDVERVLG